ADAMNLVARKRKKYLVQKEPFSEMERVPEIDAYIHKQKFKNKERQICWFTNLQKHDLGLAFQKNYLLLNWQQGSGKTAAAYHYAKYQLHEKKVTNIVVLAPAIATSITWEAFLTLHNEKFIVAKRLKDLE
ncbi:MAG: DEAD/DEAH box helicase family protein, partial [Rikenellaceae bacterium]